MILSSLSFTISYLLKLCHTSAWLTWSTLWWLSNIVSLSGASNTAAKGRFPNEEARRCTSSAASIATSICEFVGEVRGGKSSGTFSCAAEAVRAASAFVDMVDGNSASAGLKI